MKSSKLVSLSEAVSRLVPDGASVVMGCALEALIPFAAGHEMIRQKKKSLTLIGPISDILFDQLVGAGCVEKIRAAWVGNVITGSAYNFRRAVEGGNLKMEDHSNLTLAMALTAGAMGVPFMPARTALGSDLFRTNSGLKTITCPFTGNILTAIAALLPDVAVVHVQRADVFGNGHIWGNLGVTKEACLASRHVILTAEEIVDSQVITGDPNRVIVPGFRVSAVVHAPWGAHPSPVPGHYNRDHQAFIDYRNRSRTVDGFEEWKKMWVDPLRDSRTYPELLGKERMKALALKHHLPSVPVDYGY
ncbi:MAG: CoA transferase subunit A [Desulfobacterales bacterium CG07_land_8_20_14_0_80_52_14]|nr:MAG: CoA transferase subunit A [Desulfobacterales bacterium CG07_land_8_20_14_0_80_52_14]